MPLPKQSIRITDLTRLDTPEKVDAKQELLLPVACNQTEKDTFSMPLATLVSWFLLKYAADRDLSNLSDIGQGILDAKQDYFNKNPEDTDLNTFTEDGIYKVKATGAVDIHTPDASVGYFIVSVDTDNDGTIEQQARNLYQSPGNIYRRSRINNVWTNWTLITQDMYSPTFTESPTVTNPGTNANQLATIGQLEKKFDDIFKTEFHITEGLLVSGTTSYVDGTVVLSVGSKYITNDSISVVVPQNVSLTLASTGMHYVFGQPDGSLRSWNNLLKVVEVPTIAAPNTLYYNVMTDQYTDGTNIYSLAPLGVLDNGAWNETETIQFLNLKNLQATLDALNVQDKVDRIIGTEIQNSIVTSDTEHGRTMSAGHYTKNADESFDLDYGAGVEVRTHVSTEEDETDVKDVRSHMYATEGNNSSDIELTPEKATLSTPRQNGVPYEIATIKDIEDIKTTSLTFKGFVSTTEPDGTQYRLLKNNMWINSATMPTTFPVPAADIKVWDGTAWVAATEDYQPEEFDFWRSINEGEGYYWFAGEWKVMSTDMSTDDFQLNEAGKWELKENLNLRGKPTADQDATEDNGLVRKVQMDTALAAKPSNDDVVHKTGNETIDGNKTFKKTLLINQGIENVNNPGTSRIDGCIILAKDGTGKNVGFTQMELNPDGSLDHSIYSTLTVNGVDIFTSIKIRTYPDGRQIILGMTPPDADDNSTAIPTTAWVNRKLSHGLSIPAGVITAYAGSTPPEGWLICDGAAISRTTYSELFDRIGTIYGAGDGNSTFNLPNFTDRVPTQTTLVNIGEMYNGRIPEISGGFGVHPYGGTISGTWGAFNHGISQNSTGIDSGWRGAYDRGAADFYASRSSPIYQDTDIVQPAGVAVCGWIIKY